MSTARTAFTATSLPDGRVIAAGGYSETERAMASAEIFDPATGKFSRTGSIIEQRDGLTALLLDGRVLVVGYSTAELYWP